MGEGQGEGFPPVIFEHRFGDRLRKSERILFRAGLLIVLTLAFAGYRMADRFSRECTRMAAQQDANAGLAQAKAQFASQWSQFNGH